MTGAALLALLFWAPAAAQERPAPAAAPEGDTLRLAELQAAVRRVDPRSRAIRLQRQATDARLEGIGGRWLPQLRLTGEGSWQTETATAIEEEATGLPSGLAVPVPPKDRYELALEVEQLLWDGDRVDRRRAAERAAGAERIAGARVALHEVRREAETAFFSALSRQERADQLRLLREDLEARRRTVAAGVRAGTRLPAGLAAVEAELVRVRQDLGEAAAGRRASLERLSLLLGRQIGPGTVLSVADLAPPAAALRQRIGPDGPGRADLRARGPAAERPSDPPWADRPAWRRLRRTEERLWSEAAVADADGRPRVAAFVRGAFGRPGLDFFDDTFGPYAMMGVRMRWSLFDGGASGSRERALRIEARAVEAERAALGEAIRRRAASLLPEIDRLARALETDDRLVELQQRRREAALRQLEEGVMVPSEFVERRTDVFEARLRRRLHRVRLAEARARLLRIAGHSLPSGGPADLEIPLADPASHPGDRR